MNFKTTTFVIFAFISSIFLTAWTPFTSNIATFDDVAILNESFDTGSWATSAEYYANLNGGIVFDNDIANEAASTDWATLAEYYAFTNVGIVIDTAAVNNVPTQVWATSAEYYANLNGGIIFDNVSSGSNSLGWTTNAEYYANYYGGIVFDSSEAIQTEIFSQ